MTKFWSVAILFLAGISNAAAVPAASWETYGDIAVLVSRSQQQAYAIKFYRGKPALYFSGCSVAVRRMNLIVGVKYEFRNEVRSFSVRDPKWGTETFDVDISILPEARKWIMSTIVSKGRRVWVTSRGCGSGVVPYLISVEKS
jgi:hypothetical protein